MMINPYYTILYLTIKVVGYKFLWFDFQGPTILGRTKLSNAMMKVKMTNYLRKVLAVVVDGLTGTFC